MADTFKKDRPRAAGMATTQAQAHVYTARQMRIAVILGVILGYIGGIVMVPLWNAIAGQ
jgi:hypothetical protein